MADDLDAALLALVRPAGWTNPRPRASYNLVVAGGGTAGLVSAVGAASLGARVALVERHALGGDCLNVGCVPSKALLRTARAIGELRRSAALGLRVPPADVDFAAVMVRLRARRAELAVNDSAARLTGLGIDVFFGDAAFSSRRDLVVDGRPLRFGSAIIATGSRPAVPAVDGLASVPYLTNETVFDLTSLPARLVVVGAGAIGCELAQAFARLGSRVTMLDQAPRVLPGDDPDAAALVQAQLARDGIRLELGASIVRVERRGGETVVRFRASSAEPREAAADRLLVAAGRQANVDHLGLDRAAVAVTDRGIVVDDRLRTTNHRVYAAGDVCSRFKFTHTADASARIAVQNALFFGRASVRALTVPWCTYTDPEVAHVGLSPADAAARGVRAETITIDLADVDRAVLDGDGAGFVRVHHEHGRLVGCTVVAPHAGEIIGEASYALAHGGTLAALSATIHPYPTRSEAFRKAGDAYRRTRLTPGVRRWLERYFRLRR